MTFTADHHAWLQDRGFAHYPACYLRNDLCVIPIEAGLFIQNQVTGDWAEVGSEAKLDGYLIKQDYEAERDINTGPTDNGTRKTTTTKQRSL